MKGESKLKIAIISDFNIAGQPTALWRAINKYTPHEARCIIANDDSFQYDRDIILNSPEAKKEAADFCKQADFFHFGRAIFNWEGIDFNQLVNPYNCCIKYYGSELRNNAEFIRKYHQATKIPAITGTDWSITGLLPGSFYHLNSYFVKYGDMEWDDVPISNAYTKGRPLTICAGSAGHPLKGYDFLVDVVNELKKEGVPVELEILSKLNNKECLDRKLGAHVTFTSLHGAWGISGIESMFLGHVVMSCLDPWFLTFYPETPTVIINRNNLKDKIKWLAKNPVKTAELQITSRIFAFSTFQTRVITKRYMYLIDLLMNREKLLEGCTNPTTLYECF